MYSAPAVRFYVARSKWHLRLVALLWLSGSIVVAFFLNRQVVSSYPLAILLAVLVLAGGVALWGWCRSVRGVLCWDGKDWYWDGHREGVSCTVTLHLDLQNWMVVSVQSRESKTWLWLEPAISEAHWQSMRRAVIANQHAVPDDPAHEVPSQGVTQH